MPYIPLIDLAHQKLAEVIEPGDIAVDATMGNGYDTQFLAQQVGPTGRVYAFDVLPEALDETRQRLLHNGLLIRTTLLLAGHENLAAHIEPDHCGMVQAVMFNLGYRPGGDKRLTTATETTLAALDAAFAILTSDGRISIVAYPGHRGGREETEVVKRWAGCLDRNACRVTIRIPDSKQGCAPEWILVESMGFGKRS
jgi:16S rRNA C1402 N4-methylase RsmH